MKKSFLTFAVIALVLSFTSCKETPAETTEEVEVIEQIEVEKIQPEETPVIEVDSLSTQEQPVEDAVSQNPAI
ncbi:hypothetical protein [Salinimicrobium sp. GXAS 041]|uniref:hypothetical protein n=1 Tax=Salinimicrobium sp. GXAS 041 TaxID=3400806 RepID=UPI003C70FFF8